MGLWLFWGSVLALAHIYFGYEILLRLAVRLATGQPTRDAPPLPTLTLLLTVHNEEKRVIPRLNDVLAQDYPTELLEILVASDGSRDQTDKLVRDFAASHPERQIRLVALAAQGGKSAAQNLAIPQASGEVVVLTDARTRFAPGFLLAIAAPYADPLVGCVGGRVEFPGDGSDIARGQGRYWRSEMVLRACESRLGILAVASGQAMSFRRSLFCPLPEHIGDDCIIPLDVAAAGRKVLHQPDARALDVNETNSRREFRARARMTVRNWQGTWRHPALLTPWRHPGYAFALWSHKLMRWLSPLFLVIAGICSLLLSAQPFYALCLGSGIAALTLAAIGSLSQGRPGRFWRIAGLAHAFVLAQAGFAWGLLTVALGRRIFAYRSS